MNNILTAGLNERIENAKKLAVDGLQTDGDHHKQWYLQEILRALGYKISEIKKELNCDWENGTPP